jgi:hypothetical protein
MPTSQNILALWREPRSAAGDAERVAAKVDLSQVKHFIKARQKIREALRADGLSKKIDELVSLLLAKQD